VLVRQPETFLYTLIQFVTAMPQRGNREGEPLVKAGADKGDQFTDEFQAARPAARGRASCPLGAAWHAGAVDMPDDPAQLREWLERMGLEDAEVLAIFGNDELAELDPEQLRRLHGLLEARWSIDHSDETSP
jgi:hypothetical protein